MRLTGALLIPRAEKGAQISTVSAHNCALGHIAAAEALHERPQAVSGTPIFLRDFDANAYDIFAEVFAQAGWTILRIPIVFMHVFMICGRACQLCRFYINKLVCRRRVETSRLFLGASAEHVASKMLTVSGRRAAELISYKPESASQTSAYGGAEFVTRDTTCAATAVWLAQRFGVERPEPVVPLLSVSVE